MTLLALVCRFGVSLGFDKLIEDSTNQRGVLFNGEPIWSIRVLRCERLMGKEPNQLIRAKETHTMGKGGGDGCNHGIRDGACVYT